ncbi:m7GpppN-mRNA hydrolase-like [Clytia hemisphaerica]|uniref:m7GpppN-mRNA hydrolase-like n=1 Tax=Clytia hemisphaerica TaxID=252671 RepID=UPI0034D57F4D
MADTPNSISEIPQDVLQDLCSRFLINIPDNEKNDMVRICFQIEQAHWYYIDFCRQEDPDLPPCGMKPFMNMIFSRFEFLNKTGQSVSAIYEEWRKYKIRVPVFGAILIDDTLEQILLVQGFHNKASWGFPKGKVNKDEEGLTCAIREVWEEVGFDISKLAKESDFIENNFHDHQIRLYIVPGVDKTFDFKPNTRGEIKEIRWFDLSYLPAHKRDMKPKEIGFTPNNFFMIHPFVRPLRKWIQDKKEAMSSQKHSILEDYFSGSTSQKSNFLSSASPQSEERREHLKKKRKKEQEEQYKQLHILMNPLNPLRNHVANENALKSILGVQTSQPQPEVIRKLLTGNVPQSPPTNSFKRSQKDHSKDSKRRPNSTSLFSTENDEKSSKGGVDLLGHSLYSPFAMTSLLPKDQASPLKGNTNVSSQTISGKKLGNTKRKKKLVYADFDFSSPAFTNFRFDYQSILNEL